MPSLNSRKRIAYLSALTLFFTYFELLFPRILPFFRMGLGNIPVLVAFDLSFSNFLLLLIIKSLAGSLMSGTLFSPFVLISLVQSSLSGLVMYAIARLNKALKKNILSVYGISLIGSAVSGIVQIFLASLYLGRGTLSLTGPMLIFNSASGLLTAFLSQVLRFPNETPKIIKESGIKEKTEENEKKCFSLCPKGTLANIITAVIIVVFAIGIFFVRSIPILLAFLALSLFVQFLGGRKIKIFPHIGLWIFVLASCLFSPSGKVIFRFWRFSITYGSLLSGIEKAIKLSAVSALSQYATVIKISNDGIFGLTHAYYKALSDCFRTTDGSLLKKLKKTLSSTILYEE